MALDILKRGKIPKIHLCILLEIKPTVLTKGDSWRSSSSTTSCTEFVVEGTRFKDAQGTVN